MLTIWFVLSLSLNSLGLPNFGGVGINCESVKDQLYTHDTCALTNTSAGSFTVVVDTDPMARCSLLR